MTRSLLLRGLAIAALLTQAASSTALTVGFAACNKHDRPQGYWSALHRTLSRKHHQQPATTTVSNHTTHSTTGEDRSTIDGFMWLGDLLYADVPLGSGRWAPSPPAVLAAKYMNFYESPDYSAFRGTVRPGHLVGVWDDHDMGINDGDGSFVYREPSQQVFLDFFDVPSSSPRRSRTGVYSAHGFEWPNGVHPNGSAGRFTYPLCALLLDVRSGRGEDALGAEQWTWLEQQLRGNASDLGGGSWGSRCLFTVVGTGIQVFGDEKVSESWERYPESRLRLLSLLLEYIGATRMIVVSGDVHHAEAQEVRLASSMESDRTIAVVGEVTSSGLTHSLEDVGIDEELYAVLNPNPYRVAAHMGRTFGAATVAIDGSQASLKVGAHDLLRGEEVVGLVRTVDVDALLEESLSSNDEEDVPPFSLPVAFDAVPPGLVRRVFEFIDSVAPWLPTPKRYFLVEEGTRLYLRIAEVLSALHVAPADLRPEDEVLLAAVA